MASHLSAIGFPANVEFGDVIRRLRHISEEIGEAPDGSARVRVDEDPSGARVTLTLEGSSLVCLTPSFRPGQALRVRIGSFAPDECRYERPLLVSLLDDDGEEVYPLAIQIEDLALGDDRFPGGEVVELEVSALAETIEVFEDEAAFRATGTPMATRSLIPSGLFAPPGRADEDAFTVSPRVLMTGEVTAAEVRTHALLGGSFVWLTVATYGASLPVLVAAADLADEHATIIVPPIGAIVSCGAWLSGRLLAGPVP